MEINCPKVGAGDFLTGEIPKNIKLTLPTLNVSSFDVARGKMGFAASVI